MGKSRKNAVSKMEADATVESEKKEREPQESQVVIASVHKGKSKKRGKSPEKAEATRSALKAPKCKRVARMTKRICDLPPKLVGKKILTKVPITSLGAVRSTCKLWNSLSRDYIMGKAAASQQFLGFMAMESKVCSVRFNLIKDEDKDKGDRGLVDLSVKQVSVLDQVEIYKVFHCKGLLLCVPKDSSSLLVWNPYLGQTRWIKPRESFQNRTDRFALGYDKKSRSHKILRFEDEDGNPNFKSVYEIYDFSSDSWRVLDLIPHWDVEYYQRGASLKGNSYFFAQEKIAVDSDVQEIFEYENFLLCFDFTSDKFGPPLALPFHSYIDETVTLSCVREEQLAVLYQRWDTLLEVMQIWVTTKIEPNSVSWSRFLKVDMRPLTGFQFNFEAGSFFIDGEKKVAVVFDVDGYQDKPANSARYHTAFIIGDDGYFKSVSLGEAREDKSKLDWLKHGPPLLCSSSYRPSSVQIN